MYKIDSTATARVAPADLNLLAVGSQQRWCVEIITCGAGRFLKADKLKYRDYIIIYMYSPKRLGL